MKCKYCPKKIDKERLARKCITCSQKCARFGIKRGSQYSGKMIYDYYSKRKLKELFG